MTMTQKEVTINGKEYPVVFNLKTITNFEYITGTSFFSDKLETLTSKMALLLAAASSADENTKLTLKDMTGRDSWKAIQEILIAATVVLHQAEDYFEIPAVVAAAEPLPTEKEEQGKN